MRLLSLVLALVIIAGIVVYYQNSLTPVTPASDTTVKEQARQIIDNAKTAAGDAQKQLEEQQKRLEEYNK